MTPEQVAAVVIEEMLADLKAWVDAAEQWGQRYEQYGKQFGELVPAGIRDSVEADMRAQLARFERLSGGSE